MADKKKQHNNKTKCGDRKKCKKENKNNNKGGTTAIPAAIPAAAIPAKGPAKGPATGPATGPAAIPVVNNLKCPIKLNLKQNSNSAASLQQRDLTKHTNFHSNPNPNQTTSMQLQHGTDDVDILNELMCYFYNKISERYLVANNSFNFESCITGVNCGDEEVDILNIPQTSNDGTPPTLPPNSIVINYDCFENETKDLKCCNLPIPNKCKNLIDELKKLLEQLLKDIFTEFFKATSSPVIFDFNITKVVKACVVSWFLDSFTSKLGSPSSPTPQLENAVKFYIRVSVQALAGGQITNTRDLFIHVNVNSLKILTEVPNLNVLLSKILTTEISNIINEIHKELINKK